MLQDEAAIDADGPLSAARSRDASEIATLVSAEVERQIGGMRADLERAIAEVRERTPDDRVSLVVFSGDLDRVLAAFVIATGAAACGMEVSIFFTFWGLSVVKNGGSNPAAGAVAKGFKQRLFSAMTPRGSEGLGTSKMNFFGMGSTMLRSMMKERGIASLEELMATARELGVKLIACTMSMDAMGIERDELSPGLEYGGVASFVADASRSRLTLFI